MISSMDDDSSDELLRTGYLGKYRADFVAERCRRTTIMRPTQPRGRRWMNIYTNVVKTISNGAPIKRDTRGR
jgi:hypothetical protein